MMIKENRIYVEKGVGGWDVQREGLHSTEPRGHWVDDGSHLELKFHPYMQSLAGNWLSVGLGAELAGLECDGMQVCSQVPSGQVPFCGWPDSCCPASFTWSCFVVGSLPMAIKDYIAL